MAAGFTSPILLGGGQIQPAQKRKRSHEEVPPVGSRAGFRPCCLAADHRRQQRGRSSGGEEASPPSSSSLPQAPQEASPPSSPPSPQEGGSQEGLSRLTCPMGRLALESSPRPPSHWVLPGETWRDEDRIRWRPCARRRAANEGIRRKAEEHSGCEACCRTSRVSQCVAENPLGWRREREHYRDQNQQRSHPFEVPRDLQQPRLLT